MKGRRRGEGVVKTKGNLAMPARRTTLLSQTASTASTAWLYSTHNNLGCTPIEWRARGTKLPFRCHPHRGCTPGNYQAGCGGLRSQRLPQREGWAASNSTIKIGQDSGPNVPISARSLPGPSNIAVQAPSITARVMSSSAAPARACSSASLPNSRAAGASANASDLSQSAACSRSWAISSCLCALASPCGRKPTSSSANTCPKRWPCRPAGRESR